MEAPLRRGRHVGALHRLRRLRDRVPARRARRTTTPTASTSRSRSRTLGAPPTAATATRLHVVHPRVPALPGVGARDRRVPVRPRPRARGAVSGVSRTSASPAPPTPSCTRSARTAGSCRRCSCTRSSTTSSTPRSCRTSRATARRGRRSPASRAHGEDVIASAGSRYTYSANTLAYKDLEKEDERIALVGMSCQSSIPPVMKQRKAGKVARRCRSRSGCCARRRSTTRSSRSCSRRSTALKKRHEEDEHQGRVPDLDAQRRLPRGAAQGVPRVDA